VTGVGSNGTFQNCTSLGKIRLPQGVEYLRPHAFSGCSNLTGVYFEGNAPSVDPTAFQGANRCSLYHLPNTAGWSSTLGGRPTALWLPEALSPGFATGTNAFGLRIAWASGRQVVVEACSKLANPDWTPLQTNVLSNGFAQFSDADTATHPQRFYRVRWK
jgi:hypothetical protein